MPDIVGEEFLPEIASHDHQWNVGDDTVNKRELKSIHIYLSKMVRLTWHTPPPSNLGEASHSKLKADQWWSAIEFNILAAIAQVWQSDERDMESEQWE